jgi:hypothetical protein
VNVHVGEARHQISVFAIDHTNIPWKLERIHGGNLDDSVSFDEYRVVLQNPLAVHRDDVHVDESSQFRG